MPRLLAISHHSHAAHAMLTVSYKGKLGWEVTGNTQQWWKERWRRREVSIYWRPFVTPLHTTTQWWQINTYEPCQWAGYCSLALSSQIDACIEAYFDMKTIYDLFLLPTNCIYKNRSVYLYILLIAWAVFLIDRPHTSRTALPQLQIQCACRLCCAAR